MHPIDFIDSISFYFTLVHLRLKRNTTFHYFHGPILCAFMKNALKLSKGTEFPKDFQLYPLETSLPDFKAGERYRFAFITAAIPQKFEEVRCAIIEAQLRKAYDPSVRLGGNFDLESLTCLKSHRTLKDGDLPEAFNCADADSLRATLGDSKRLTLRFRAPLRLSAFPNAKNKYFDENCFDVDRFFLLLQHRLYNYVRSNHSQWPALRELEKAPFPPVKLIRNGLTWIDAPYHEAVRKNKIIGGAMGSVVLEGDIGRWLPLLWAGQYIGVGQSTNFGFGRYVVAGSTLECDELEPPDLLSRIADIDNLDLAQEFLRRKKGWIDKPLTREELRALSKDLLRSDYQPGIASGFVLRRKERPPRALAVPPLRDRIAQRAACQVLQRSVDFLLEDCSFGYRRGYSRHGAADRLREYYDQGYRTALDADISAFFDQVDWGILEARMEGLFQLSLCRLLMKWVKMPVWFEERMLSRERGLLQGSAVSPLLANLYLDRFDEILRNQGFRLVRYADDFIVVCRTVEEAEQAHDKCSDLLENLRLRLNLDKTSITNFDEGFQYLGYLFCRSTVLDIAGKDSDDQGDEYLFPDGYDPFPDIVRFGWFGGLGERKPLEEIDIPADAPIRPLTRDDKERTTLFLTSADIQIKLSEGRILVNEKGSTLASLYPNELLDVYIVGQSRATSPALSELAREGVPVHFLDNRGQTLGSLVHSYPFDEGAVRPLLTYPFEHEFYLPMARVLVSATIHNRRTLVLRWRMPELQEITDEMKSLSRRVKNVTSFESLRGLEGQGAILFFKALGKHVPPHFHFKRRQQHPSPDPINAMLSFGYTLIQRRTASILWSEGLPPSLGFYHSRNRNPVALACDVMEPYRVVADMVVMFILKRHSISRSDFTFNPDSKYPCLMKRELLKIYLQRFEELFRSEFKDKQGGPMSNYYTQLKRDILDLKAVLKLKKTQLTVMKLY